MKVTDRDEDPASHVIGASESDSQDMTPFTFLLISVSPGSALGRDPETDTVEKGRYRRFHGKKTLCAHSIP